MYLSDQLFQLFAFLNRQIDEHFLLSDCFSSYLDIKNKVPYIQCLLTFEGILPSYTPRPKFWNFDNWIKVAPIAKLYCHKPDNVLQ